MSNLKFSYNQKENNIIASYKFQNCKFSSQKTSGCKCSKNTKKTYNFCNKKNIKILSLDECFNCKLFETK
jgi:hypothetical protein